MQGPPHLSYQAGGVADAEPLNRSANMEESKAPESPKAQSDPVALGPKRVHTGSPVTCPVCLTGSRVPATSAQCVVCRALTRQQAHWNVVGDYAKAMECLTALQRHHDGPMHKGKP